MSVGHETLWATSDWKRDETITQSCGYFEKEFQEPFLITNFHHVTIYDVRFDFN